MDGGGETAEVEHERIFGFASARRAVDADAGIDAHRKVSGGEAGADSVERTWTQSRLQTSKDAKKTACDLDHPRGVRTGAIANAARRERTRRARAAEVEEPEPAVVRREASADTTGSGIRKDPGDARHCGSMRKQTKVCTDPRHRCFNKRSSDSRARITER